MISPQDLYKHIPRQNNPVTELLTRETVDTLVAQGHVATSGLIKSVSGAVNVLLNETRYEMSMFDYGLIVDKGVKPERVPFTPRRVGQVKRTRPSRYVTALMDWVRVKGLTTGLEKEVRAMAFAIARKHKREGIPTKGSARFSQTGKRLDFIQETISRVDDRITQLISDQFETAILEAINQVLKLT